MSDFKRPLNNRFFEWLGRTGLPVVLWWNGYDGISISRQDLQKLKALKDSRVVICSNHSHRHDPIFLFSLSAILQEQFNYIAAREIFDWWPFGFHGYCLQRVGCYSITRGIIDRPSISMSKKLIVEGKRKLVVFPECEISCSHDRLLPVEPGLAGLFLKAADDLHASAPGQPLYILPVALKYEYVDDISQILHNALTRIENELVARSSKHKYPFVGTAESSLLAQRFDRALRAWTGLVACRYKFGHANWANTEGEIDYDSLIEGLIDRCSSALSVCADTKDAPQAVHRLRTHLDLLLAENNGYLPNRFMNRAQRASFVKRINAMFSTILRLATLKDFAELAGKSQENLANGVDLLERELFGKATQKGHRMVYLSVGDAVDVMQRYELYRADKREEVRWLTGEIERQWRNMLAIDGENRQAA